MPTTACRTEQYDNNGNTLASGARTFKYDFENRLKSRTTEPSNCNTTATATAWAKAVGSTTTRYSGG